MTAEDFLASSEVLPNSDVVILHLGGHLDAHTFERVETTFQELFDQNCFKLIVNLSAIEYISSAGVGAFFNALSQARENGGNIVLANVSPTVNEVLIVLGLGQIFSIAENQNAALAFF
jgi:anti-sigma B factor antagonist